MDELAVQQPEQLVAFTSAGSQNYYSGIRAAARGYWSGVMDYYQFYDAMEAVISRGIPQAYYEGAALCGILPSELTPEERHRIEVARIEQLSYVDGFARFIEERFRADGGKWGPVQSRTDVWINRYNQVANQAKLEACADEKLEWVLNAIRVTKEHCKSCLKLAGKVKRASQWKAANIQPQGDMLECGGWACGCDLLPTDKPLSMGKLPQMP